MLFNVVLERKLMVEHQVEADTPEAAASVASEASYDTGKIVGESPYNPISRALAYDIGGGKSDSFAIELIFSERLRKWVTDPQGVRARYVDQFARPPLRR